MLVLSRKQGEGLWIGDVYVVVLSNRQVQVGIEAPEDVRVIRDERDSRTKPTTGYCVLTRTVTQGIYIGDGVYLKVLKGGRVKVGLHGSSDVDFVRSELKAA